MTPDNLLSLAGAAFPPEWVILCPDTDPSGVGIEECASEAAANETLRIYFADFPDAFVAKRTWVYTLPGGVA